jgi:DNA-dependent RNA polymerase auxiliary subunit epsilon
MDIEYKNVIDQTGDFYVEIEENPMSVSGNRLVADIFEMTFMTSLNDSLLSYGYGANGINIVKTGYDPNDTQSIASMMKMACDNTVLIMKADQATDQRTPSIEKVSAAYVDEVNKQQDRVYVKIRIVPEEYEPQYAPSGITLTLPL